MAKLRGVQWPPHRPPMLLLLLPLLWLQPMALKHLHFSTFPGKGPHFMNGNEGGEFLLERGAHQEMASQLLWDGQFAHFTPAPVAVI